MGKVPWAEIVYRIETHGKRADLKFIKGWNSSLQAKEEFEHRDVAILQLDVSGDYVSVGHILYLPEADPEGNRNLIFLLVYAPLPEMAFGPQHKRWFESIDGAIEYLVADQLMLSYTLDDDDEEDG